MLDKRTAAAKYILSPGGGNIYHSKDSNEAYNTNSVSSQGGT